MGGLNIGGNLYNEIPAKRPEEAGITGENVGQRGTTSGTDGTRYFEFNGTNWIEMEKDAYEEAVTAIAIKELKDNQLSAGPIDGKTGKDASLRYPDDIKHGSSDYVLFQFGKYIPPFSRDVTEIQQSGEDFGSGNQAGNYSADVNNKYRELASGNLLYNLSNLDLEASGLKMIVLPMPQDLSNEIQAVWQGKQFTAGGRAAIAGLAGAQFHYSGEILKNLTGHLKGAQTAINTAVLNSIPGVGGNLEFNDVSGSTRGIVINPNAELMYDSPEMREIGMTFKMVPRNPTEAATIKEICQTFRKASLPTFGGKEEAEQLFGDKLTSDATSGQGLNDENKENALENITSDNNWIRVPNLCKFSFMKGGSSHPYITQFKACAINKVEVNYTPDGTYATYHDGAPLSVELTLNFMETKVIFRKDVGDGF